MIDSRPIHGYGARVWSLLKSLLCAAALLGVIGEIDCFATAVEDDCCATEQCSLCAHSVVCVEVAPLLPVVPASQRVTPPTLAEPAAPSLARLTPPPRPLS